jgi:hypothetical protein
MACTGATLLYSFNDAVSHFEYVASNDVRIRAGYNDLVREGRKGGR